MTDSPMVAIANLDRYLRIAIARNVSNACESDENVRLAIQRSSPDALDMVTQDGGESGTHQLLSDDQIRSLKSVLEEFPTAQWSGVFRHEKLIIAVVQEIRERSSLHHANEMAVYIDSYFEWVNGRDPRPGSRYWVTFPYDFWTFQHNAGRRWPLSPRITLDRRGSRFLAAAVLQTWELILKLGQFSEPYSIDDPLLSLLMPNGFAAQHSSSSNQATSNPPHVEPPSGQHDSAHEANCISSEDSSERCETAGQQLLPEHSRSVEVSSDLEAADSPRHKPKKPPLTDEEIHSLLILIVREPAFPDWEEFPYEINVTTFRETFTGDNGELGQVHQRLVEFGIIRVPPKSPPKRSKQGQKVEPSEAME